MKAIVFGLLVVLALNGCGVKTAIQRNDDRYLRPGALDLPLTGVYDTYQYKFLDKYRITHQWPHTAGTCSYRKMRMDEPSGARFFAVRDIYESEGKTWQRMDEAKSGSKPYNFDRYVRSVKAKNPVYGDVNGARQKIGEEEIEAGLQTMCLGSWYVTSHALGMRLHKEALQTWKNRLDKFLPKGTWSSQRVAGNTWTVQEVQEHELSPRKPNSAGGGFQTWLLPIRDTGYIIVLQLGASQESLQYPEVHVRMKAAFRHLIESVKIEPLP